MSDFVPAQHQPPPPPHGRPPYYPGGAGPSDDEGEGMDIRGIFGVFRRRYWVVLAVTVVVTGLTFYLSSQAVPTYRSSAVLRVTDVRTAVTGGLGDPWTERLADPLLSQLQLLRSHQVVGEAVDAKALRLQSETRGFRIGRLESVVVDADAPADTIHLEFSEQGVVATNGREQRQAAYGEPLDLDGVRFTVPRAPRVEDAELVVLPREVMIGRILAGMRASQRQKTDIIDIDYTDTDPAMAQTVVSGLVEAFQNLNVRLARQQSQLRRDFIEEQLATTRAELTEAQQELTAFRSRERGMNVGAKFAAQQSALMNLELQREQLANDLRRFESVLSELRRPRDGSSLSRYRTLPSSPGLVGNPVVSQLYGQLVNYETEREVQTTGEWALAPTHPDMQRLDALIASTETKLIDAIRSHISAVQGQIATMDEMRARTAASVEELPATVIEEAQLVQRVESAQARTAVLQGEYQRIRISEAVETGQIRVIDPARYPAAAVPPNVGRTLMIGLLLGLALGGGSAYLLESLNTSIRRREEMEAILHIPALAVIPQITSAVPKQRRIKLPRLGGVAGAARERNGNGTVESDRSQTSLLSLSQVRSSEAEAFRTLRTNLIFSQAVQTLRTMVVTSAMAGEGKTTTAANLAIAFAQQGMRVLLIGGDLRRPRIEKMLGVAREPGLTEVLLGQISLKEGIHRTAVPGLKLLPCGTLPQNPSELLGGERMRSVLRTVAKRFDVTILDTPPLLVASDASVLGATADGVLMVVRAGQTDRNAAQAAMQQLTAVGARVVGAILNDPDAQVPRYGAYYGYHASRYYAADEAEEEEQVAVSG